MPPLAGYGYGFDYSFILSYLVPPVNRGRANFGAAFIPGGTRILYESKSFHPS
jgi:hypothetical protein